jgi:peptide/histidine transporter 3/4
MITVGIFLSLTFVVYVSNYVSWAWGFGTLSMAMALANLIFFLGTPFYRHRLPSGSALTRLVQVVVAALRKRRIAMPTNKNELYEVHDKESAIPGSRKLPHTDTLRFFDQAAVETQKEKVAGKPVTPWRLCTVTQVEELKVLVKVIPIWATAMILNTVFLQILNFGAQQAMSMNRKLFVFTAPAASVPVAAATIILIFLPFYDRFMVPFMRKYTGNPRGISFLQRIGVGLFITILAATSAAVLEKKRRQVAWETGKAENPLAIIPISAWWLTIPISLIGFAEIFASIGQLEFFYDQAPDGIKSIGTALFSATNALGAYLGSFLISVTTKYTGRHGHRPWIDNVISIGHMDYNFWLLAGLSGVNIII